MSLEISYPQALLSVSDRIVQGFRDGATLWKAGASMVHRAGLKPYTRKHEEAVRELYGIVDQALPDVLLWDSDHCVLDLLVLAGGETATPRQILRTQNGQPCLEWLPYAEIRHLFPWKAPDSLGYAALACRTTAPGCLVNDIVHWTHVRPGQLRLTKGQQVKYVDSFWTSSLTILSSCTLQAVQRSYGSRLCQLTIH